MDGWRRAAGLVLRHAPAHFTLSAFGLWLGGDPHSLRSAGHSDLEHDAAARLGRFMETVPEARTRIRCGPDEDCAEATPAPCYTLAVTGAVSGPGRFVPPETFEGSPATAGSLPAGTAPLLSFVLRVAPGEWADVWVRVNHVGADGVPVQELLTALENAWGTAGTVAFPTPREFAPFETPRPIGGGPGLSEIQSFVDFSPLLEWRTRTNARLPSPMTVAAALQWRLARHARFAGRHMGSTVEVAACGGLARGVGVVVVRPSDYPDTDDGLARYVRDYNRGVELTRNRASGSCKTLDALAFAPAGIARAVLQDAVRRGGSAFGSMGLTILRDAKVFVAPISDPPHADGFVSLGSLSLPTAAGGKVGCVWMKGPHERAIGFPAALREAIA